jgi:UDP-glucose:(heptosyl)LPS alpha-1,3-glucosyltransferase
MKIAFVVHDYRRREGHSRYVVELATRFAREHEVHVFANEIEADENSPIHFHHVAAWRPNALTSIMSFAFFATLQVRGKFDIIHNQGLCGWRGNVFTAHICNRAWDTSLRRAMGTLSFREWLSGTTLSALEHLFYHFAGNRHIIAVSRRIAGDLDRCYGSVAPTSVVYHGVDLKAFAPAYENLLRRPTRAECGLSETDMAFLFIGDIRKGGRQCIQALAKIPDCKLLFVSRSSDAQYRALASRLGVQDRVVFVGTSRHVERYYAAADALVLPTHYDSFAMVVTEAMASALAVIVSREAGAAELIQHGTNGLVLDDYQNVDELAGLMRALVVDRAFARKLGDAARIIVEQYSWDVAAARTMEIYRQVCKQPTPILNFRNAPAETTGVAGSKSWTQREADR